jgi:hypothetical protein
MPHSLWLRLRNADQKIVTIGDVGSQNGILKFLLTT